MKIAAVYDLHGNLPALEAVLEEIRQAEADLLFVGGDIMPGPMPLETLELLLDFEIPKHFIKGNCEYEALNAMAGKSLDRIPEAFREVTRWSAMQIYPKYEELLKSWDDRFSTEIEGIGKVLFCHATPRDYEEIFTRLTSEEKLLPIFENVDADLVVCGHTHMQFDRIIGKTRVVNAGSLGMPYGDAVANWLLLDGEVRLRQTVYDLEKAAERIRKTDYPQAEEFAAENILKPPSEESVLEFFSKAEIK